MPTVNQNGSWKTTRVFVIAGILFLAGLLLGFIPEYRKASNLQDELHQRDQRITRLQSEEKLSSVRNLASLLYLEATRKNYGIAAQHATSLFDHVRATMGETSDPALKSAWEQVLKLRDPVIEKIAKGDPSVETPIREVLDRLQQVTIP